VIDRAGCTRGGAYRRTAREAGRSSEGERQLAVASYHQDQETWDEPEGSSQPGARRTTISVTGGQVTGSGGPVPRPGTPVPHSGSAIPHSGSAIPHSGIFGGTVLRHCVRSALPTSLSRASVIEGVVIPKRGHGDEKGCFSRELSLVWESHNGRQRCLPLSLTSAKPVQPGVHRRIQVHRVRIPAINPSLCTLRLEFN
jgi:hypothetical protein